MTAATSNLLDALARRAVLEAFTIETGPAFFETAKGERVAGYASVSVSRSSIAVRFGTDAPLHVESAGYAEANGRIGATNGSWLALRANVAGAATASDRLFGAQELVIGAVAHDEVAASRLVFAGAAWEGTTLLDGRRVVAAALSKEAVSHHDARLSIAVEGDLDKAAIEGMDRAGSFVAGLDIELLRADSFSAQGELIRTRHMRGFRRVGRGPHSPFTGIPDSHRMRAWTALVTAVPQLEKAGVPIVTMINHIAAHNTVAEINSSAVLLLLASQTAAYHRAYDGEVVEGAAQRTRDLTRLSHDLSLPLNEADLDRFEKLRVELLDAGFFHKPGYETGRPQTDIKFLRDIAHMIVLRLCGYSGPFYGAETFAARDMAASPS
jgi:hypothetical protein